MRIYIGFDDTDVIDADRGTGKLARWFEKELPEGSKLWGVVRQQLLVSPEVPYTSHNSAACVVVDAEEGVRAEDLIRRAVRHVETCALPGSDPGVCVVEAGHPDLERIADFGRKCTAAVQSQTGAIDVCARVHLSGHGGTNDGIIGAAAAVGLTASGWSGRFVEFGGLRDFPEVVTVAQIQERGIRVLSLDRDAKIPAPDDILYTRNWVRPRLMGGEPVLPVKASGAGTWENMNGKRKKGHGIPDVQGKDNGKMPYPDLPN